MSKKSKKRVVNEKSFLDDSYIVNTSLQIFMRSTAYTIAQDLISVKPIYFESDEDRIKRECKIRIDKINSIIEGVNFEITEEHKPKSQSPKNELMYLDFKYSNK